MADNVMHKDDDTEAAMPDEPEPWRGEMTGLEVASQVDRPSLDLDQLTQQFREVVDYLAVVCHELNVILIDEAAMIQLHGDYLDDPTTTDVMTFDLRDPLSSCGMQRLAEEQVAVEGEVYINVDQAARCAADRGYDLTRELLLYALHGLLHLMGYDDRTESDSEIMHAKEDEVLIALGVGATYRQTEAGA